MSINVAYYQGNEAEWDRFILQDSMNGLFLETRKFINYHPEGKFKDCSICIRKGNQLVGAILACEIKDPEKTFFAHKGTTFGGLTVSRQIYSAQKMDEVFTALEDFFRREGYRKVYLKMVPAIYQKEDCSLIDYFLYKNQFRSYSELNFYIDLRNMPEDITSTFSSSKRRDYRYSLKDDLQFRRLETKEEIASYYEVLQMNLQKLNLPSVHTLDDLYDLALNRFRDRISFYGVFHQGSIIAGSMLFKLSNEVIHTQYLSSNADYLDLFPMDFLIGNLIELSVREGYHTFSFGICTEDQGRYLNLGLSRFKEGFGAKYCINYSFEKEYSAD